MLVFFSAFLFDVVPFPFPPAFTIMVFLQIVFDLNIWMVIIVGVAGSILGRYVLTLYIPISASKIFKPAKNEDVQYLGKILKEKGWKSQLVIVPIPYCHCRQHLYLLLQVWQKLNPFTLFQLSLLGSLLVIQS